MRFITFVCIDLTNPVNIFFLLVMLIVTHLIPHIYAYKNETGNSNCKARQINNRVYRLSFRSPVQNQKVAVKHKSELA
jgi:hypothetical protein